MLLLLKITAANGQTVSNSQSEATKYFEITKPTVTYAAVGIHASADPEKSKSRVMLPVTPSNDDTTTGETSEVSGYANSKKFLDRMVAYKKGVTNFVETIEYPKTAIEQKIEGTVKIFFVVEPDGSTSNIRILKSLNYDCDEAVIKAVHKTRFNPGMIAGQAVRVHCILPVHFGLDPSDTDNVSSKQGIVSESLLKMPAFDNNRDWLDRMVTYKKGEHRFVQTIDYPQSAIENKVEGIVKVFFVVEPDGTTSNIRILKSLDYDCDQAVIKAVHKARFNPGMINGQPVRVHCILPVHFGLTNPAS